MTFIDVASLCFAGSYQTTFFLGLMYILVFLKLSSKTNEMYFVFVFSPSVQVNFHAFKSSTTNKLIMDRH